MFHWVYVSTAVLHFDDQDLTNLLSTARKNNEKRSLTGLLLHSNKRFMQVLEGPEEKVMETFSAINADTRHKNIYTLQFQRKSQRDFPDWRMGFKCLDDKTKVLNAYSCFLEPDYDLNVFKNNESDPYRMLMSFKNANDQ